MHGGGSRALPAMLCSLFLLMYEVITGSQDILVKARGCHLPGKLLPVGNGKDSSPLDLCQHKDELKS